MIQPMKEDQISKYKLLRNIFLFFSSSGENHENRQKHDESKGGYSFVSNGNGKPQLISEELAITTYIPRFGKDGNSVF